MIGLTELLIILVIILLLFGPKKLPKLARSMGAAAAEFRRGLSEGDKEKKERGSPAKKRRKKKLSG